MVLLGEVEATDNQLRSCESAEGRTDAELVRAALAGDHDAWEKLVRRRSSHLHRAARSFRLDDTAGAGVVQAAFQIALLHGRDCCGYLCAAAGRTAEAVTVWAVADALSRHTERVEPPADAQRRGEPLNQARHAFGPARARAGEERGAAMIPATAAGYVLMPIATGPQQPSPQSGLERLTVRERELVTLVAQGRTNAQIAAQLYISVRTVSSHLERVRDKTGCRRRADLTRLALSAGVV